MKIKIYQNLGDTVKILLVRKLTAEIHIFKKEDELRTQLSSRTLVYHVQCLGSIPSPRKTEGASYHHTSKNQKTKSKINERKELGRWEQSRAQ